MKEGLGLGDCRNGDLRIRDTRWELHPLTNRRFDRKPPEPFFVHSGEVVLFCERDCDANDLIQLASCFLENGLYVGEALTDLFLDVMPSNASVAGSVRAVPEMNASLAAFTAWLYADEHSDRRRASVRLGVAAVRNLSNVRCRTEFCRFPEYRGIGRRYRISRLTKMSSPSCTRHFGNVFISRAVCTQRIPL